MYRQFALSVAASVLAVLAVPASAGTTQVSGVAVFNNDCLPTGGSPPDDLGDYPPIDLSGSLDGCLYTYVSASKFNPSGTYIEQGTEIFDHIRYRLPGGPAAPLVRRLAVGRGLAEIFDYRALRLQELLG